MDQSTENAVNSLEALANAVVAVIPQDAPFNQIWGWNLPSITKTELAQRPRELAARLRHLEMKKIDAKLKAILETVPPRLNQIQAQSVPNMASANAGVVVQSIELEMDRLERALPSNLSAEEWEAADEANLIPKKLATRLRSIEAHIEDLGARSAELQEAIREIEAARATAEQLPTDLASLAEARGSVGNTLERVAAISSESEGMRKDIAARLATVTEAKAEAERVLVTLGIASSAATSKGLADAFQTRARGLNYSVGIWVTLLMADLAAGSWVGALRFAAVEEVLKSNVDPALLWGNLIFSVASVAAPIWFGWVATKQISQRFKLAEDYAFKASVASAYEGYRIQAARIDAALERRLFEGALTRMEEQPLRFVETENYGSPWHELTASPVFARALEMVPGLLEKFTSVTATAASITGAARRRIENVAKTGTHAAVSPVDEDEATAS